MDGNLFRIDDARFDRRFHGGNDAPDRRHSGIVDPVDDVRHQDGITIARVYRLIEAIGAG